MSFSLIAGPCVLENEDLCLEVANQIKQISLDLGINYIFKASFDKANRTSINSFRGPGIKLGLEKLKSIKNNIGVPILTDIHESHQADEVAKIVDVIQIPAFLCRQTDLIVSSAKAALKYKKKLNIKKAQFLAPWDMKNVILKCEDVGFKDILLTERGSCFGYNNLVVDYRSIPQLKEFGYPVFFDATHSVQLPGGGGNVSQGQRQFVAPLARAAMAVGVDGIFMEVHPNPSEALSDGPNMIKLSEVRGLLETLVDINNIQ